MVPETWTRDSFQQTFTTYWPPPLQFQLMLAPAVLGGFEAAARVECPVTFILGERDQMTLPKNSESLGRALKAEVRTLAAGHALMTETPEELLSTLRAALG